MKIKVGDTVLLPSKRPRDWAISGAMDRYLGIKVKVTEVIKVGDYFGDKTNKDMFFRFGGSRPWTFKISEIEKNISTNIKLYKYLNE